jgi:hypothetical protein
MSIPDSRLSSSKLHTFSRKAKEDKRFVPLLKRPVLPSNKEDKKKADNDRGATRNRK